MDPNACLEKLLRDIASSKEIMESGYVPECLSEVVWGIEDLHKWIIGGGFLPNAWQKKE